MSVQNKGDKMKLPLLPFLKLLIIQATLSLLIAIPLSSAQAESVVTLKQHINTYLYEGDHLNLTKELNLNNKDKVIKINIKAQAIETNASLTLKMNGMKPLKAKLSDKMQDIQFKLANPKTLRKIKIESKGAFVKIAKAKLLSDEPMDDDLSHILSENALISRFFRH